MPERLGGNASIPLEAHSARGVQLGVDVPPLESDSLLPLLDNSNSESEVIDDNDDALLDLFKQVCSPTRRAAHTTLHLAPAAPIPPDEGRDHVTLRDRFDFMFEP